jgi:gas vesicle protein GvpL/GvpF
MSTGEISMVKATSRNPRHLGSARLRAYLYAVIADTRNQKYGDFGIDAGCVYSIPAGRVAAVVSEVQPGRIRPQRSHLAAHQEVLKKLLTQTTPLPMSFGMIAASPEAVRKLLLRNQQALLEQLGRVAGKVEMGVRITWDVPNIFEYFVNTHSELRLARDRLLGGPREPTQDDKIEVGRMFERMLNEDREAHLEQVRGILSEYSTEIQALKCRSEREVTNLACLVGREATPRFETGVFEVAKCFDQNFALDYNGPWAPHNFVELNLEL